MQIKRYIHTEIGLGLVLAILAALFLTACGGGNGPAITTLPQTIHFSAAPALSLLGTATVTATASSGLVPSYSSTTPGVCSVNSSTGLVTDLTAGTCVIAANQSGSAGFAPAAQATQSTTVFSSPNQTISFSAAPTLTLYGHATVYATATSGLAISYSSTTPSVCTVNSSTGDVTDLTAGVCTIAANQAGDSYYVAAPPVTLPISVIVPGGAATVPGVPTGIAAKAGNALNTVTVSFISPASSGGSPITGYTVTSNANPGVITGTGTASPITVTCPTTCTGYTFNVIASNSIGDSLPSAQVHIVTSYNVTETFYEPMTQPDDSIFTGSFTLDSTTNTVSNLTGTLTESMTGTPMATVPLAYQLSAVSDGQGGLLVTTFVLNTTNTFYGGGFAPGSGFYPGFGSGTYYGYPGTNLSNAYAMIYINLANPTAALTQAQIDKLAYADCTMLGMMGATCMTGTTLAGYGSIGTMSGFPVSQTITKQ
jgi:hypothetical protein